MPQFLIPKDSVTAGRTVLKGDEAHHARDVLRLKDGDAIRLFDGEGAGFEGRVASVKKSGVEIEGLTALGAQPQAEPRLSIAQSILPRDAMDWSIWKATELGADEIVPLMAERSVARADKHEHWQKTAVAACKQCGRLKLPVVKTPVRSRVLDFAAYGLVLIGSLETGAEPLPVVLSRTGRPKSVLLLVGPEGDFTTDEMRDFRSRGAKPVTLGSLTLKSETAAIYMLSALKYHYER